MSSPLSSGQSFGPQVGIPQQQPEGNAPVTTPPKAPTGYSRGLSTINAHDSVTQSWDISTISNNLAAPRLAKPPVHNGTPQPQNGKLPTPYQDPRIAENEYVAQFNEQIKTPAGQSKVSVLLQAQGKERTPENIKTVQQQLAFAMQNPAPSPPETDSVDPQIRALANDFAAGALKATRASTGNTDWIPPTPLSSSDEFQKTLSDSFDNNFTVALNSWKPPLSDTEKRDLMLAHFTPGANQTNELLAKVEAQALKSFCTQSGVPCDATGMPKIPIQADAERFQEKAGYNLDKNFDKGLDQFAADHPDTPSADLARMKFLHYHPEATQKGDSRDVALSQKTAELGKAAQAEANDLMGLPTTFEGTPDAACFDTEISGDFACFVDNGLEAVQPPLTGEEKQAITTIIEQKAQGKTPDGTLVSATTREGISFGQIADQLAAEARKSLGMPADFNIVPVPQDSPLSQAYIQPMKDSINATKRQLTDATKILQNHINDVKANMPPGPEKEALLKSEGSMLDYLKAVIDQLDKLKQMLYELERSNAQISQKSTYRQQDKQDNALKLQKAIYEEGVKMHVNMEVSKWVIMAVMLAVMLVVIVVTAVLSLGTATGPMAVLTAVLMAILGAAPEKAAEAAVEVAVTVAVEAATEIAEAAATVAATAAQAAAEAAAAAAAEGCSTGVAAAAEAASQIAAEAAQLAAQALQAATQAADAAALATETGTAANVAAAEAAAQAAQSAAQAAAEGMAQAAEMMGQAAEMAASEGASESVVSSLTQAAASMAKEAVSAAQNAGMESIGTALEATQSAETSGASGSAEGGAAAGQVSARATSDVAGKVGTELTKSEIEELIELINKLQRLVNSILGLMQGGLDLKDKLISATIKKNMEMMQADLDKIDSIVDEIKAFREKVYHNTTSAAKELNKIQTTIADLYKEQEAVLDGAYRAVQG